jgi:hypothetical protein
MYKSREDIEEMIDMINVASFKFKSFLFWIIDSLSVPSPGEVHESDDNTEYSV